MPIASSRQRSPGVRYASACRGLSKENSEPENDKLKHIGHHFLHKTGNVLNKLPQAKTKTDLHESWLAECRVDAEQAFALSLSSYESELALLQYCNDSARLSQEPKELFIQAVRGANYNTRADSTPGYAS